MHGSYVTLGAELVEDVATNGPFDLILASDMLHLPGFLGAVGEARGAAAVVLYMHENQLTYPLSPRDSVDEAYAMINWASMTVADLVLFNSQFHLDVWCADIPGLLHRFPVRSIEGSQRSKSDRKVIPIPENRPSDPNR